MIAGGGRIGCRLAIGIERSHLVKVIEVDFERANELSRQLVRGIVLNGDATDASMLKDEAISETDMFCAVTNNDETNILSTMLAKRCGVGKTLAIINNQDYLDILQGDTVDIALSSASFTIGAILKHTRRGDVLAVHSLRRGAAEAIEIIAHGSYRTSQVVGRTAKELPLPEGTTIGAIVRGDNVLIAHGNVVVETDDHVILFLLDRKQIGAVEKLFAVGFGFFS